jgi:ABC-type glycerol-3-phosphate transport system substrate-binding protein
MNMSSGATRRWILGTGTAGFAGGILAACGGEAAPAAPAAKAPEPTKAPAAAVAPTTAPAPAAAGKVIELRTHARADSEIDGYAKNVEAFNKKFEGKFKAVYEGFPGGELYVKQETLMAGGTIGDIHYAHQSQIKYQEYAKKNLAVAIDSYLAKDSETKLADWPQRAQDALKVIDGKVFGLPVRGQVAWMFMYWNRDMLKTAGIAEPTPDWTLDQMVEAAKKVQQSKSWPAEFYPAGYTWGGFEQLVGNVRRFNGEVLSPENGPGTKAMMDSAPAVQMAKWFYDNIKAKLFSPRTYGAKEFGEGKLAFYFGRLAGERGAVNNAAGKNFEWTFDISPKGPTGRRGGFLSIDTQQINVASKNKDAAWELLKALTSKDAGINLALQPSGSLTPGFRKDVYCSDQLLGDPRFPKTAMKANCDNIDQPEGFTYPANLRLTTPGGFQETINKYMNDIADLKAEPTPAYMKQMNEDLQKILSEPSL